MQLNNGVITKISTLPMYTKFVPAGSKESVTYNFHFRRTIPWKLSCETSSTTSRKNVFSTYSQVVSWSPGVLLSIHLAATILLALTAQCLVGAACTGYRAVSYKHNRRYFIIQVAVMGVLQMLAIIACFISVQH